MMCFTITGPSPVSPAIAWTAGDILADASMRQRRLARDIRFLRSRIVEGCDDRAEIPRRLASKSVGICVGINIFDG
jgi:hypothetical protein